MMALMALRTRLRSLFFLEPELLCLLLFPDFDVRNYGYSKLTPFIKSLGNYETGRIPTGSGGRKQIYFRMKEDKQ